MVHFCRKIAAIQKTAEAIYDVINGLNFAKYDERTSKKLKVALNQDGRLSVAIFARLLMLSFAK